MVTHQGTNWGFLAGLSSGSVCSPSKGTNVYPTTNNMVGLYPITFGIKTGFKPELCIWVGRPEPEGPVDTISHLWLSMKSGSTGL